MKSEKLLKQFLRLICYSDGEEEPCSCCSCDWCWWWPLSKSRKPDIQYVLHRSDAERGYDNEGCVDGEKKNVVNDVYSQIEARRHNSVSTVTPVIDMKPIQFWTSNSVSAQSVQPRIFPAHSSLPTNPAILVRVPSPALRPLSAASLQPHLYELSTTNTSSLDDLSDEEKLARFDLGQLHFSVLYELSTRVLLVRVIEAKDLSPPGVVQSDPGSPRTDHAHSNPYVKLCLLPDQKDSRQTSVKKKTQSPVFEETFAFEIPFREAQMRTLQLKVKDFDRYSRHCVIGQVMLPLVSLNLVKGKHMWKALVPCEKELPELGEILLCLNYLPSAGRLNVDVIKAKQLLPTDLNGGAVPYVRISLVQADKLVKSKKTSFKRSTVDPVFNESFSFHLTPKELNDAALVATVWDHNAGVARNRFIGRIVLGKHATGPGEITHWERMLQEHRSAVAQWHTLRSRPECDQISLASRIVP